MVGAIINSAGIVVGGVVALLVKKPIPTARQSQLKALLGVFTVWFGLRLTWTSLSGSAGQVLKQLAIVLLAMALGKVAGRLMGLQNLSNTVGQYATKKMTAAGAKPAFSDGLFVATALFCVGPLSIFASVDEGLSGFSKVFFVKAVMDGLGTMAFSATFGWSVMLSAIPLLAWQGAIILGVRLVEPQLHHHAQPLLDSISATDGLLIFSVALIILQLKKVAVADYLPSLVFAPLLTLWLW